MKRIIIASVVIMLLVAIVAQAQTVPRPEYKKLGVWIGNWTTEYEFETTAVGSKAETITIKGPETCAWFAGEYQVVCDHEGSGSMGKFKALGILGYSVEKKQYFQLSISSLGSSAMSYGTVDGSAWTFESNFTVEGKTYQSRVIITFTTADERTFKVETSEDGKNWKFIGEGKSIRK